MNCGIVIKTECCNSNCLKEMKDEESEIDEYEETKSDEETDGECCSSKTLLNESNLKKHLK